MIDMNNFIFSTIAVVLTVIPMNAADIYVSPSGSDKAAGSEQAPLQTLKKAIESPRPEPPSISVRAHIVLRNPK